MSSTVSPALGGSESAVTMASASASSIEVRT